MANGSDMPVYSNNSITQADMDALANFASIKLLPLVNAAIVASAWSGTWSYTDDGSGNPLLDAFSGNNVYDIPESTNIGDNSIMVPQPDYVFDLASKTWRSELNRMRGDYYYLLRNSVAGAESIFENLANIVSGPWVVTVNDVETFPQFTIQQGAITGDYPLAGIFSGSNSGEPCWFSDLKFLYAAADAPGGITIDTVRHLDLFIPNDGTNPGGGLIYEGLIDSTVTLTYAADSPGQFKAVMKFPFSGASLPPASAFSPTATPSTGVTFTTEVNTLIGYSGNYNLVVTIDVAMAGSGTIVLTAGKPVGYTQSFTYYYSRADLFFSTSSVADDASAIHPSSAVKVMTPNAQPAGSFTLNGTDTVAAWILSDRTLKGVWTAKTLPAPGINVFLDQDLPPFVSGLGTSRIPPDYTVAVGTGDNTSSGITASSMRVPTSGDEDLTRFGALQSSMSARPAPYQVLRSTDFVPWDYGYPTGLSTGGVNVSRGQTAAASGTLNQYGLAVPADATQVKIRLRQRGAALGWKFIAGVGTFQYGEPLPSSLKILVRKADHPTLIDYDFQITGNDITIDPNGGGSYLATVLNDGFFYAVYTDGGIAVEYDLVTLIETAASPSLTIPPPRQYFPEAFECFSYCLTPESEAGLLWSWRAGSNPNFYYGKRIPQSGHCIFKVRATRLPALNPSGISVTPAAGTLDAAVTIGQNILQPDNTLLFVPLQSIQANGGIGAGSVETGGGETGIGAGGTIPVSSVFTFLIPAGSRDSGDLSVFWPVLSGNELVYKCDEQVIVEAWVNWQPMFFNAYHARGSNGSEISYAHPVPGPIHFKSVMYFLNQFAPRAAGYPGTDTSLPFGYQNNIAQVQFPICADIYNDLEKCLNLIP